MLIINNMKFSMLNSDKNKYVIQILIVDVTMYYKIYFLNYELSGIKIVECISSLK